ncbi:MAG: hypothetical protein FJZ01_22455 [Candidatus Sericytochromatia bacterium]|nr:hypothetical protein [Candidatus Tanganyikabacteria bacterium]
MAVGQVGSSLPTSTRLGPVTTAPGGGARQATATPQTSAQQAATRPGTTQASPLTSAIQTVSTGIDEMNARLDGLIGALSSFLSARQGSSRPPANQSPSQSQPASPSSGTTSGTPAPGAGQAPGPAPGSGGTGGNGGAGISVDEAGDININIVINVEPPRAAAAPAPNAPQSPAAGAGSGGAPAPAAPPPKQEEPVKVEIVQPPPPPPPPPPPTNVTTSDFGSITINGKQTFIGTVFGIFFTPPEAANYIVGVLNTNPANGGIEASTDGEGRVILAAKDGGAVKIDDIQAESDGDVLNNALLGFTKGQTGTGRLIGEIVRLFDPTKIDTSDPNRPPVLRT